MAMGRRTASCGVLRAGRPNRQPRGAAPRVRAMLRCLLPALLIGAAALPPVPPRGHLTPADTTADLEQNLMGESTARASPTLKPSPSPGPSAPLSLTILHMNDHHSHVEEERFVIDTSSNCLVAKRSNCFSGIMT